MSLVSVNECKLNIIQTKLKVSTSKYMNFPSTIFTNVFTILSCINESDIHLIKVLFKTGGFTVYPSCVLEIESCNCGKMVEAYWGA
jgi:hypothetical protein